MNRITWTDGDGQPWPTLAGYIGDQRQIRVAEIVPDKLPGGQPFYAVSTLFPGWRPAHMTTLEGAKTRAELRLAIFLNAAAAGGAWTVES